MTVLVALGCYARPGGHDDGASKVSASICARSPVRST